MNPKFASYFLKPVFNLFLQRIVFLILINIKNYYFLLKNQEPKLKLIFINSLGDVSLPSSQIAQNHAFSTINLTKLKKGCFEYDFSRAQYERLFLHLKINVEFALSFVCRL